MKKFLLILMTCCLGLTAKAQSQFGEQPKLVVGIVVDQMRWDYLSRYYDKFTGGGFRRLIDRGYSCNNCLINYVPTITAIGHASVYTGSTPAFHGICGNNFYIDGQKVYCCEDSTVQTVGSDSKKGMMSPRNMVASTIGDQLRLHTDFRSKVVGVSYKDRAAILPAGHSATAAYWLDLKNRCFISSTYYMTTLPRWAEEQNKLLAKNKEVQKAGEDIGLSPLCGTVITDMAIAALKGERLGKGDATDMLCVSYSQTDVIGHKHGTRGTNTDQVYLQLDRDLGRLLKALDTQVGEGHYLLFLTADHGAAHNWKYMQDNKQAAGPWSSAKMVERAEAALAAQLGAKKGVVKETMDYRLFLDYQSIREQGLDIEKVKDVIIASMLQEKDIIFAEAFDRVGAGSLPQLLRDRLLMGYYPRRSGDIYYVVKPGFYEYGEWSSPTGTTHGEWNPYDAHIPCLFYGWRVPHGATSREVHINDIAPTVCQLLHIQQPNACTGEAIVEITR